MRRSDRRIFEPPRGEFELPIERLRWEQPVERACYRLQRRNDVRHFRTDRVVSAEVLNESFSIPKTVITKWLAEHQDD